MRMNGPLKKILKRYEVVGDCWLWTGPIAKDGYAHCKLQGEVLVHRLFYKVHIGDIPDGLILRHTCDVRHCVNPVHLIPGTYADNTHDAVVRGRIAVGERIGNARLTDDQVREIRTLITDGHGIREIGRMLGLNHKTVSDIHTGRTWSHLR